MGIKKFNINEFYNQRLYETSNFAVIPSLGSMVEGWLLIIPKKHYTSYGYLQSPQLFEELSHLISKIGGVVQKIYGEYVIFENGALCSNKLIGCGVDYAHIHIVPTKYNLIETVENNFDIHYNWKQIHNLSESAKYIENHRPYLYYSDQQRKSFITTNDDIPSQLFRKALASVMGIDDKYDWKSYHFIENVSKTIDTYKAELSYQL